MIFQSYSCKICRFESSLESDIVKHVFENHNLTEKEEDANHSLSESESSCSEIEEEEKEDNGHVEKKCAPKKSDTSAVSFVYRGTDDLCKVFYFFLF